MTYDHSLYGNLRKPYRRSRWEAMKSTRRRADVGQRLFRIWAADHQQPRETPQRLDARDLRSRQVERVQFGETPQRLDARDLRKRQVETHHSRPSLTADRSA